MALNILGDPVDGNDIGTAVSKCSVYGIVLFTSSRWRWISVKHVSVSGLDQAQSREIDVSAGNVQLHLQ